MDGGPDQVPEFSPRPNRFQILLAVLGLFVLAAFAAVILPYARTTIEGVLEVFLLVYGVAAGFRLLWLAIQQPERLKFTRQGLWVDGRLAEWKNIERMGITVRRNYSYNVLKLRDPERFRPDDGNILSRLGKLTRFWYGGEVAISWTMRDRNAKKFEKLLEAWYARYRPPPESAGE